MSWIIKPPRGLPDLNAGTRGARSPQIESTRATRADARAAEPARPGRGALPGLRFHLRRACQRVLARLPRREVHTAPARSPTPQETAARKKENIPRMARILCGSRAGEPTLTVTPGARAARSPGAMQEMQALNGGGETGEGRGRRWPGRRRVPAEAGGARILT